MKTYFIPILAIMFLIVLGCEKTGLQSHKKNDLIDVIKIDKDYNKILQDSIKNGTLVLDSFLDYQFGDPKSVVELKTKEHLKFKVLHMIRYDIINNFWLTYYFFTSDYKIPFHLNFEYDKNANLFKISLTDTVIYLDRFHREDLRIYNMTNYYKEILNSYMKKYTTRWYYVDDRTYCNISGSRLISISFKDQKKLMINYIDLRKLAEIEDQNILKQKKDESKTLNDI